MLRSHSGRTAGVQVASRRSKPMNRRLFLASSACAVLTLSSPARAAPFASSRLSVRVAGSGPDVILIPGLTAGRDIWSATVAAVPGYRYHLVQVAGFAGTGAGGNAAGEVLPALTTELARYIRAAGLRAPAVIGHSMGGTLAMMLAARHRGIAGRIMVVDMLPAPAGLLGSTAAGVRPLADWLFRNFGSSPAGQQLFASMLRGQGGAGARNSDPDLVARVTHELAVTDLTPELGRIAVPMTIVYATPPAAQGVDPERIAAETVRAYRGARAAQLRRVPNSGHMLMLDQPKLWARELKAFLTRA